jgi:hypothetical protein
MKGFIQEGVDVECDSIIRKIIKEHKIEGCSVEKFCLWYNVGIFQRKSDEKEGYEEYNYFVELLISLIEECYLEKSCWPFVKLYMNHMKLAEKKWNRDDTEWFFLEHVRRGKKLGKIYEPHFDWKRYFAANERIRQIDEEMEFLLNNDIMPGRLREIRKEKLQILNFLRGTERD